MLITRTSMLSGITRTENIPVTNQQLERWKSGQLIQNAMSELTEAQREFIMTGITQDEWEMLCQNLEESIPI